MRKMNDGMFRDALKVFEEFHEENEFLINYSRLKVSGSFLGPNNSEIDFLGEIDREEDLFWSSMSVQIPAVLSEQAGFFLRQITDDVEARSGGADSRSDELRNMYFEWFDVPEYVILVVSVVKERLSAYEGEEEYLKEALQRCFLQCLRFSYLCVDSISQYGQIKKLYAKHRLPKSLHPAGLVTYCLSEFEGRRTLM